MKKSLPSYLQVLPQRIQEWKMSECVAETKDIRQLEKIRRQQLEAREVLQQLDQRHLVSQSCKIPASCGAKVGHRGLKDFFIEEI